VCAILKQATAFIILLNKILEQFLCFKHKFSRQMTLTLSVTLVSGGYDICCDKRKILIKKAYVTKNFNMKKSECCRYASG